MAAAVVGEEMEEVGISEDSASWTLEKEDLLVEAWQAKQCLYDTHRKCGSTDDIVRGFRWQIQG